MRISDWSSDVCSSDLVHKIHDAYVSPVLQIYAPVKLLANQLENLFDFPVRFREVDAACANPLLAIPQSMICDFEIQVGNLGRETRCRENLGCEQPGLYTARIS